MDKGSRTWTYNRQIWNLLLYQLSYSLFNIILSAPYGALNEASLLSGGNPHLSVPFGAPKEPSVPNASRLKTFDIFDIRL